MVWDARAYLAAGYSTGGEVVIPGKYTEYPEYILHHRQ